MVAEVTIKPCINCGSTKLRIRWVGKIGDVICHECGYIWNIILRVGSA